MEVLHTYRQQVEGERLSYILSPSLEGPSVVYELLYLLGKFTLTITDVEYNHLNYVLQEHFVKINENAQQQSQGSATSELAEGSPTPIVPRTTKRGH